MFSKLFEGLKNIFGGGSCCGDCRECNDFEKCALESLLLIEEDLSWLDEFDDDCEV